MKALILVDIQNDFLPGGALAVPDGDAVVPVANSLMREFPLIVATQDWHPDNHGSFAASHPGRNPFDTIDLNGLPQTLWPVHCVNHTGGACFAPGLDTRRIDRIFPKGTDPTVDSYSGFFDNGHRHATGMSDYLRGNNVREVVICGLATDYCVKFTALDAAREGFSVTLVESACRGVGLKPGDIPAALAMMQHAGVRVI